MVKNFYIKLKIRTVDKDEIFCDIINTFYNVNEPTKKIHLHLALLKNPSRFEFAIEKSVEIGVNEITPLITERVINKELNKIERWQSIALSAMKQSQRCYLPIINESLTFDEAILKSEKSCKIIAHEIIDEDYEFIIPDSNEISLFIGPEGGFTEK